jgi:hypothetical protein
MKMEERESKIMGRRGRKVILGEGMLTRFNELWRSRREGCPTRRGAESAYFSCGGRIVSMPLGGA